MNTIPCETGQSVNERCAQLAATTSALLTLERGIAGVCFLDTREEFERTPVAAVRAKIAYCVAVKAAMAGKRVKAAAQFSGCNGGSRALGMVLPDDSFSSGRLYHDFGLYRDMPTSRQVAETMTARDKSCHGFLVQPLGEFVEKDPEVVILVTDARNAMRLIQGYTYHHGSQPSFKMAGNQALCSECTAHPLATGSMNVSMLCSGTRHLARWKSHELAIGIPFNKFAATVDGLLRTADAVELDPAKQRIRAELIGQGLPDPHFRFGHTYYTDLEKKKSEQRRRRS